VGTATFDQAQMEVTKSHPGPPVVTTAAAASGTGIAGFEKPGWWDYTSSPNSTNRVPDNTDIDAANPDWNISGGGPDTATGGQTDPFGGTDGWLFGDSDAVARAIWCVPPFTSDGTKAQTCYLKEGTAATNSVGIFDQTAGLWRHLVDIAWNSGIPSLSTNAGAGILYMPTQIGTTGWWEIRFTADGVLTANTNRWQIYPASSGAGFTGDVYLAFPENAVALPSLKTVSAGAGKNADYCQWNRPAQTGTDGMAVIFDVKHSVNEADEAHSRYFSTEGAGTGDIRVASSSSWLWTVAGGAGYFSTDKAHATSGTN
jgi:hypothetical protein